MECGGLIVVLWFIVFATGDNEMIYKPDLIEKIRKERNLTNSASIPKVFAGLSKAEVRQFLGPLKNVDRNRASAVPIGANLELVTWAFRKKYITGFVDAHHTNFRREGQGGPEAPDDVIPWDDSNKYAYVVYDSSRLCGSWAPAVTSAMSLALSIHHRQFVNLSLQFVLDCDPLGEPCLSRPPLDAYKLFVGTFSATGDSGVPQFDRWDQPSNPRRAPHSSLSKADCEHGCYPGWATCPRNNVMTGSCLAGSDGKDCPIYFLGDWRWIMSHLWEVGPVTSTIVAREDLFQWPKGEVYTSVDATGQFRSEAVGMLDVTIIGWGEEEGLGDDEQGERTSRWWYVIPHFGRDYGDTCAATFAGEGYLSSLRSLTECGADGDRSGVMRFSRRWDDSGIESQAVGAVPYNFQPLQWLPE